MSDPLFLGFDLSTQQLKAALIDRKGHLVHESAVHFDRDLPQFGTTNGALHGDEPGEVYCPVIVWIEALDVLMSRLSTANVAFDRIVAVSGAAQQHGSVYWDGAAHSLLHSLDPSQALASQLVPEAFSTTKCPIWQDSSTTEECKIIENALGGDQAVADLSGSRAYERFTGAQILKLYRKHPRVYENTSRISLVSSFLASLFLCDIAPIEVSDASGMNLMDIEKHTWSDALLDVCGPNLRSKLGPDPVLGGTSFGAVGAYWVKRWNFHSSCIVAPFTGDNPSTVVSLSSAGDVILSLGTSTTLLIDIPPLHPGHSEAVVMPKRTTTSHLLAHPTSKGSSIAMLCYKNGALAREYVRDHHAQKDWDTFNKLVESTPPGNNGLMGFYFPLFEIIPQNVIGDYFFNNGQPVRAFDDTKVHPRAILESQLLSLKVRIEDIVPGSHGTKEEDVNDEPLKRLLLTGGGSANQVIRQMAADILDLDTYVAKSKEGGSVGGAILALYAWWKLQGAEGDLDDLKRELHMEDFQLVAKPNPETVQVYDGLDHLYRRCEKMVMQLNKHNAKDE